CCVETHLSPQPGHPEHRPRSYWVANLRMVDGPAYRSGVGGDHHDMDAYRVYFHRAPWRAPGRPDGTVCECRNRRGESPATVTTRDPPAALPRPVLRERCARDQLPPVVRPD